MALWPMPARLPAPCRGSVSSSTPAGPTWEISGSDNAEPSFTQNSGV